MQQKAIFYTFGAAIALSLLVALAIYLQTRNAPQQEKKKGITVYSLEGCPWCSKAEKRLNDEKLAFRKVNHKRSMTEAQREKMPDGSLPKSYPTIWVDGANKGGFSEMDSWMSTYKAQNSK